MKGRYYSFNSRITIKDYDAAMRLTRRFVKAISVVLCLMLAGILLGGCKTVKHGVNESRDVADSVRVEYREKIVKVPVTVYVEVPAQRQERETPEDSSFVETDFAYSWAIIKWRGDIPYLFHSIDNKPQKIEKTDSVPVTEKEKVMWRTRRVTYNKTEIRERQLAWWQKGLMWTGGVFLALIIIFVIFVIVRACLRR